VVNDNAYKDMALMLANWALDFGKTKQDALDYMDRILVLDELNRARMVQTINERIDEVRSNNE
jgi:hypothetical protein